MTAAPAGRRAPAFAAALTGVALLCVLDALIKGLSADYSALTIAAFRFLFGGVFAGAVWMAAGRPRIGWAELRRHGLRGALGAAAAVAFFHALSVMTLVKAVTLSFIAPLLIPLAAWPLAGERPKASSLAALGLGFLGVMLAAGPDLAAQQFTAADLEGLVAVGLFAVSYAAAIALLRKQAQGDHAAIVGLMQNAIPAAFLMPLALFAAPAPPIAEAPAFALLGLVGVAGWQFLIYAYARLEAQSVAPIEYTALGWSALLGYLVFRETPTPHTLLGAGVIIAACLFAVWAERRAFTKAAQPAH